MKILIVDDDFVCRNLLLAMVKDYSECDVAINGKEAISAVKNSIKNTLQSHFSGHHARGD